jgi:GNAT superfamily N-acetyltransferase
MTIPKINSVAIRSAVPEDAELLAELGRETFHDAFVNHPWMPQKDLDLYLDSAFTVSQIASELNDPKTIFLLAEIDGQAVAYAKMESGVTASGVIAKNPVKIKRLYSKQKFIGFGVGKILLEHCLVQAKRLNHDIVWLTVWEHNLAAQNFYRKWNFETSGTIDFLLGQGSLTDLVMQRPVLDIKIITPASEKDLEIGRGLGYQYAANITNDPIIEKYFKNQDFYGEIDRMPKSYEPPEGAYLLAFVEEKPAGIVSLKRITDEICEMKRLFVTSQFQGLGLGRILAERIINEGRQLGYTKMRLDSHSLVMAKAIKMYKSMGFYEIEPYNQNFVPHVIFLETILDKDV